MSDDGPTETKPTARETTGPDWIIPVLSIAFAAYYLWSISGMRWEARVSGFLVATILVALIAIFGARTAVGVARGRLKVDLTDWSENSAGFKRQVTLIALIVGFIQAIPHLGFTLTVFAFLSISMAAIARLSLLRSLLVSAAISFCGYLLFIVALQTNFPVGPFERLLASLTGLFP